jgi:hypothetical protein
MTTRTIIFTDEFTDCPGGRLRIHGDYSGEEFREKLLEPALAEFEHVVIDLDGVIGFPASFVDEAFGTLIDKYGADVVRSKLEFRCTDNPFALQSITEIISQHAA